MTTTPEHDERIAKMTFASVYPHYVTRVEKNGRTKEDLHQVIEWLTGFDERGLQKLIDDGVTFETFFKKATLNPNASLIKGVICGYRIEDIVTPLTKQVRYTWISWSMSSLEDAKWKKYFVLPGRADIEHVWKTCSSS